MRGLESTWIRKDGAHILVRETAKAVKDLFGKTVFYEGIVEDISGKRRAELFDRECRQVLEMVARNEPLDEILLRIAALLEVQASWTNLLHCPPQRWKTLSGSESSITGRPVPRGSAGASRIWILRARSAYPQDGHRDGCGKLRGVCSRARICPTIKD